MFLACGMFSATEFSSSSATLPNSSDQQENRLLCFTKADILPPMAKKDLSVVDKTEVTEISDLNGTVKFGYNENGNYDIEIDGKIFEVSINEPTVCFDVQANKIYIVILIRDHNDPKKAGFIKSACAELVLSDSYSLPFYKLSEKKEDKINSIKFYLEFINKGFIDGSFDDNIGCKYTLRFEKWDNSIPLMFSFGETGLELIGSIEDMLNNPEVMELIKEYIKYDRPIFPLISKKDIISILKKDPRLLFENPHKFFGSLNYLEPEDNLYLTLKSILKDNPDSDFQILAEEAIKKLS